MRTPSRPAALRTRSQGHLDADPLKRAANTIGATIAAAMDGSSRDNVKPLRSA